MALNSTKIYNRDLSWLRFNHRVLQEASDPRNPLMNRLQFLAIFSSNLDEFFKVRVSDIRKIKQLDKPLRKKLITKPNKLLVKIKEEVDRQQIEFGSIYKNEILPALAKERVYINEANSSDESTIDFVRSYFDEIAHLHTPIIDDGETFLENEALYLVGKLEDDRLVWVKISAEIPRFVKIPDTYGTFTFVDDIIRFRYEEKYHTKFYAVKISRDAELYIDNEFSGNLLKKIQDALPNRESGQITRVLVDGKMPQGFLQSLKAILDINETDVIRGGRYHNLKDFFSFPQIQNEALYFKDLPPLPHKNLHSSNSNIFEVIEEKDQILSFPYESFDSLIRLVETAATDASTTTIKITLYRVSNDSAIAKALLKAVKNGKQVFVFIETKARFDEKNNIKWGKILEENGAIVKYSYPGIKVHSKIFYIERQVGNKVKSYAYIGTGNFNEKSAKLYTDFGLLTGDIRITTELLQVFQVLEQKLIIPKTKHLLVSPFNSRSVFTDLIETEIENSQKGKPAHITLKMNSLQDPKLIKLLYKANRAGVTIRLLVRGICCLVPGIENQSERITVTSIVDRFLEHSRVYLFANGGNEKVYIGSADWMTRNLDHRIEVVVPILQKHIAKKIRHILELQLRDTVKARAIDAKQNNMYVINDSDQNKSSQHLVYEFVKSNEL